MRQYFKIGEMAKMFNMNIRTLRYYDETGLLHPIYVDPETNYRYYSIEQFEQLNTIRYLRSQEISINDIRAILYHRDPERIADLMIRQQEAIAQQIERLKETSEHLAARVKHIKDARDMALIELLRIEEKPERPIATKDLSWRNGDNLELPLRDLENTHRLTPSYFLGKIGLTVSLEDIQRAHFDCYHQIFCMLDPGETQSAIDCMLPAGKWALWRYHGTHSEAAENWSIFMEKLRERRLKPIGDGVEIVLVDFGLTECPEDFITELQVPVGLADHY